MNKFEFGFWILIVLSNYYVINCMDNPISTAPVATIGSVAMIESVGVVPYDANDIDHRNLVEAEVEVVGRDVSKITLNQQGLPIKEELFNDDGSQSTKLYNQDGSTTTTILDSRKIKMKEITTKTDGTAVVKYYNEEGRLRFTDFINADKSKIRQFKSESHQDNEIGNYTEVGYGAVGRVSSDIEYFYNSDGKLNIQRSGGDNLLFNAIEYNHIEIILDVLDAGVDINSKNNDGYTPLHEAVVMESVEIIKLLLEKGAKINSKDNNRSTPLYYAVAAKSVEIVKLLLEKGADINSKNNNGGTPLHWAVKIKSV